LVCQRDGAPTKLCCAQCDAGICPACMVRTPVGYKCPGCAGGDGARTRRRSKGGVVVMAGLVVVAMLVGASVLTGSPGRGVSDPVAMQQPAAEAPVTGQAMIGDEARDGQLVFVVDAATCSPRQAAGAGKLCTLRFNVKNTSTSPAMVLGRFQYLVDAQSKTYGADDGLTRAVPDNAGRDVFEINVNPDVVVPLVFVFELPENVEPTEAQFKGTGRGRLGVNVRLERRAS
jgi:hypothetical protein